MSKKTKKNLLLGVILGIGLVTGTLIKTEVLTSADDCKTLKRERDERIANINQEAEILIKKIESEEFKQRFQERKLQFTEAVHFLLRDEPRLNKALKNREIPPKVRDLLNEARSNPNAVSEFADEEAELLSIQFRDRIRKRQEELINKALMLPIECRLFE